MIGLQEARVLLVDDSLEEALPVIKAFSKKGIPVAYFDGTLADLPSEDEKLKGIRLALLDMDLIGGGDRDENKISTLITRLQAILAVDNGPYMMIAWTKHAHLVDLLETKLFKLYQVPDTQDKVPLPVICIKLEKSDFGTEAAGFDISKLSSSIEMEIKKSIPLTIMQSWENRYIRAALGVTNTISNLVSAQGDTLITWRNNWNTTYLETLILLAKEEIGKNNLNKDTFLDAVFSALNPLHVDLLETNQYPLPSLPDSIITGLVKDDKDPNSLAGKINTNLHLSFENTEKFRPGNIYNLTSYSNIFPVKPRDIFNELVQSSLTDNDKDDAFSKVTPILLEVSASCDFAQNKIKLAKFVAGLIITADEKNKFKLPKDNTSSLLQMGIFWFSNKDSLILLSSQHIVSAELTYAKEHFRAIARLRNQGLITVQFWMAQQLSRPGIMMLR